MNWSCAANQQAPAGRPGGGARCQPRTGILGSLCAVPHGYTSCVMLPAVLAWNAARPDPHNSHTGDSHIAAALGRPDATASVAVRDLVRSLGLPDSLPAVGVADSQLDEIAARAAQHPVVRRNSRPIDRSDQVTEILALAWNP
ncbi:MAG: iron-containing alcohol dehydrogenase [Pseudohongiellaceae bacterium]